MFIWNLFMCFVLMIPVFLPHVLCQTPGVVLLSFDFICIFKISCLFVCCCFNDSYFILMCSSTNVCFSFFCPCLSISPFLLRNPPLHPPTHPPTHLRLFYIFIYEFVCFVLLLLFLLFCCFWCFVLFVCLFFVALFCLFVRFWGVLCFICLFVFVFVFS